MKKQHINGMELAITKTAKSKLCKDFNSKYKGKSIKLYRASTGLEHSIRYFYSLSNPVQIYKGFEHDTSDSMLSHIFKKAAIIQEFIGVIEQFSLEEMRMVMYVIINDSDQIGKLYWNGKERVEFKFKEQIENQLKIIENEII